MSISFAAMAGNSKAKTEWFRDAGFGLFIHWGLVSQIGKEISWPVYDASEEFRDKYFSLYKTDKRIKELKRYIEESVKLTSTELEKKRVDTWKKGVWEYMKSGHRQYYDNEH